MNPKQKAEVVRLIKNNLKKITLAIGDGANDVNMIQEAHIGIGIYGKEGMRAVQASDFAIGEFQCLWRLLLIHGRWCYRRTAEMIIYFFYKNMIFTIPHFFFSFLCGSSAQTIFDDWYISFYNLFFTALPLIVRAVFEQDVDYKIRIFDDKLNCTNDSQINKPRKKKAPFTVIEDQYLKDQIPKLYYVGQLKTVFTTLRFLGWVLWAIFQSLILFGLNLLVFNYVILKETGINSDLWSFSITYFTTIILLVDLKLALNTTFWTCLNWLAFIPLSVLLYFAYFLVSNYLSTTWAYLTPIMLLTVFDFYATVLLGLLTFFLADYIIYVVPNLVFNSSINSLIEYSKKKRGVYQNLNNTTKNDNKDNQFIQEKDNSLLKSVKNDDIDEKNVGDIELSLQQHFSIEKPENSITLQDVKI